MKPYLILTVLMFTLKLQAENKEFSLPPTELRPASLHQGDLFTIKMVPGDKETLFYVVGKKAGHLKIDKLKIEAIFDLNGEKKRLSLSHRNNAFILPRKATSDLDLELKGEAPGEVDRLKIKVNP